MSKFFGIHPLTLKFQAFCFLITNFKSLCGYKIIDPPTTIASHCLFDLTMEHVEPQEVNTIQQSLRVYVRHKCINPNIVDNLKQPLTLGDGKQPLTPGNGFPIATNVVTPTIDLENAPSPSLDSIVIDFATIATIDYLIREPSIRQLGHVHIPICLQGYFNVVEIVEELKNLMEIDDEPQSFQEATKNTHWINAMEQEYCSLAHNAT
jgi:hypothetical protein